MKATEPQVASELAIAIAGRAVAAERKASTQDRCREAMSAIESDVAAHSGVYPFNDGRITVQEVLRRANLSKAALEKPHHRGLKDAVTQWVALSSAKIARGAKSIRKVVTQRVEDAKDQVHQIQQAWAEAELEYIDAQHQIARLTDENAILRREVDALRERLSCNAVVPIRGKHR
ncbi:hypothetical protein FQV39_04425 [Bosea sp. F3-2]|uniref:hypothetical protein n=1 Tax=Bosea sp. F3-2 TaxID=2599640 RepID=UPI0011ECCD89|nr:hypothetical protein [Bosea sp. F3-2]QEL21907.1 hypothetical protein FQV39_04425 [Bosea sp. F3-2]